VYPDAATEAHIRVRIIDNDEFDDSGRAFRIVLTDPSDGTKLAHSIATISIIEDDGKLIQQVEGGQMIGTFKKCICVLPGYFRGMGAFYFKIEIEDTSVIVNIALLTRNCT